MTTCLSMNSNVLNQLQFSISKQEQDLFARYLYDDQYQIVGMVLRDHALADAHYISLMLKDYLEHRQLIDGQIIVASFPESGQPTAQILSQLFHTVTFARGESKDIALFVDQPLHQNISSILIVDSEKTNREFIKLRLELKGYKVFEANNGYDALALFSEVSPDLVITELTLPIVDGFQFIHKVRVDLASEAKIIVLTDKHLTKDKNRAFELGASDYVTKPYSFSELEWRIKKLQLSY